MNLSFLKDNLYAHRGLHQKSKKIYENTLASFDEAISHGYAIELDTNILKDGTIVVFHDRNLKRMCARDDVLKELNYGDLKDVRIKDSNERIHTLKEVLDYIDGRVPLMIELKPFGNKKAHSKAVYEHLKAYKHMVAVQSFNPYIVLWFKRHAKEIIRGQISESFSEDKLSKLSKWAMKTMLFNKVTKPHFINYGIKDLPNKYVEKQRKKGVLIFGYVADNQKSLDYIRKQYDNAVFEGFMPKQIKVRWFLTFFIFFG